MDHATARTMRYKRDPSTKRKKGRLRVYAFRCTILFWAIVILMITIRLHELSTQRVMVMDEHDQFTNYDVSSPSQNLSLVHAMENHNSSSPSNVFQEAKVEQTNVTQQETHNDWANAVIQSFRDEFSKLGNSSYENLITPHPDLSKYTIENSLGRGDEKQLAIIHIGPEKTGTTVRSRWLYNFDE